MGTVHPISTSAVQPVAPARTLADLMDKAMKDQWNSKEFVLAFLRSDGEEVEIGQKLLPGHPSEWLSKHRTEPDWDAVCISHLGHATSLDDPGRVRRRVRMTVAVDCSGDFAVIRYPDGKTQELSGMQGILGGQLQRFFERGRAAA